MFKFLRDLLHIPEPTAERADIRPGKCAAEGVVRIDEPLRSPVRGQACAAFFYRAFLASAGMRGPSMQRIKQVEVYAPFTLEMNGGTLTVVPGKTDTFDHSAHQDLQRRYSQGFQATEDVILPGAKVRVTGKVRAQDGGLVLRLASVSVLQKQSGAARPANGRKERRKKAR